MSEQLEHGTVDFDSVRGASTYAPEGKYVCALGDVRGGESKSSGKPMITAVWEIVEGDLEGVEIYDYYPLTISQKEGKDPFSFGIAKMRGDLRAVGHSTPKGWRAPTIGGPNQAAWYGDPDKLAVKLGQAMRGKRVEIQVRKEVQTDKQKNVIRGENGEPKYNFRPYILGAVGGSAESAEDVL